MVLPYILVVCLAGVLCLIPLAIYFFWLAGITRRPHPTPVAGTWDFAGVLLGLSGFIFFGGGVVLTLFQSNFRYWMRGNVEALRAMWIQERVTWSLLVFFYLSLVLGTISLTLLGRRRMLVVYNIEPATFETLVTEVFEQMGRSLERRGKLWVGGVPLFELDSFENGRTVTLRWVSDDQRLYEEVCRQLRAVLATQQTSENPASRWIMSFAVGGMTTAACCAGLLIYGLSLIR